MNETTTDVLIDWAKQMGLEGKDIDEFVYTGHDRLKAAAEYEEQQREDVLKRIADDLRKALEKDEKEDKMRIVK